MRIYLIRHGETDSNKEGRIQGSIETDLNEVGITQCEKTAQYLLKNNINFDYCFVSPQKRAFRSLEIISQFYQKHQKSFPITVDDLLKEIHCGRWEGKLVQEIEKQEPELLNQIRTKVDAGYPEGESILDVRKRAEMFYNNKIKPLLENPNSHILILSHGNLLRVLASVVLNLPPEFAIKVVFFNMGISILEGKKIIDKIYFKIITWNSISHL
jgi:broad specificity phosphatase PhoE